MNKLINLPLIDKSLKDIKCGECHACCIVFSIEELNKPDNTPCVNLTDGNLANGCCSIHNDRNYPKQCKEFKCMWLQGLVKNGDIHYRPDKLGLVLMILETPPLTNVIGVFKVKHFQKLNGLGSKAKQLLRQMEKKTLFFMNEKLIGPKELIKTWMKLNKAKVITNEN